MQTTMTRDQMEAHLTLQGWEQAAFDEEFFGLHNAHRDADVWVSSSGTIYKSHGHADFVQPATLLDGTFWRCAAKALEISHEP